MSSGSSGTAARHVLVCTGVCAAVVVLAQVLVGLLWLARIMARTGRRERDLVLVAIPIYNVYVVWTSVWRYTSTVVDWPIRADRASQVLQAQRRLPVAAAGFALAATMAVASIVEVARVRDDRWLPVADRQALVGVMVDRFDVAPSEVPCVLERLEARFAPGSTFAALAEPQRRAAIDDALAAC